MNVCPKCGSPAKHIAAGVSKKTGLPYSEFWVCGDEPPCPDRWKDGSIHDLSWKSERQWNYLNGKVGMGA
jgi:hypothetical protein